jgi:C4-dicarboxylate-specific signal transduction histidine kinase
MASIAHEINQPLTSILSNASAGLRHLPAPMRPPKRRSFARYSATFATRAGEVIERVRALTGKRPLERQALDMNEVAGEIVTLVRGEARRRGVTLRAELVPSLPAIDADPVSLQQVVLNLVLNGMDAWASPPLDGTKVS